MFFTETAIRGAFLVDPDLKTDQRGFFARTFCALEFEQHGLATTFVQTNVSFSALRGTLRGLHYQVDPASETKLVRCTRGAIHDVIVDLRPGSPTFLQSIAVTLTFENHRGLYVPKRFAHGFQALSDDVEVSYQVDAFYSPEHERGLRYDDPVLAIQWPETVTAISEKDQRWPLIDIPDHPDSE